MTDTCFKVLKDRGIKIETDDSLPILAPFVEITPVSSNRAEILTKISSLEDFALKAKLDAKNTLSPDFKIFELFAISLFADIFKGFEEAAAFIIDRPVDPSDPEIRSRFFTLSECVNLIPLLKLVASKYEIDFAQVAKSYRPATLQERTARAAKVLTEHYQMPLPRPGAKSVFVGITGLDSAQRAMMKEFYPHIEGHFKFPVSSYCRAKELVPVYEDIFEVPLETIEGLEPRQGFYLDKVRPLLKGLGTLEELRSRGYQGYPYIEHVYKLPAFIRTTELADEFDQNLRILAELSLFSDALIQAEKITLNYHAPSASRAKRTPAAL